ncbi:hypothetical protein L873DRAFT_1698481 [Choiromyces venosus 120613-1]|uniref:DNA polymerase lambda n=1 Tax=Choiromyces venosus 120613-1 TaxID=1336337 RepID=A0A3N4JFW3_9PEZI|nr:hypothetical protein L873DRAFT_1698481 [Choiromyces venosus 120613-1]
MIKDDESLEMKKHFFEGLYSLDSINEEDDRYEDNLVSTLLTKTKDPAIRNPRTLPKLTRARTTATSAARSVSSSSRAAVSRTLSLPAEKLRPSTMPSRLLPRLSTPTAVASSARPKSSRPPRLKPSTFAVSSSSCTAPITTRLSSPSLPDISPMRTPTSTAPPESSRMSVVGSGGSTKRKRSSKAATQPPVRESQLIFSGLVFYFIPNDIKNPARKMRVQKATEFGAFCINEWNNQYITHVIVENNFKYLDVLKYLKLDKLPENVTVVNQEYTGDCLHHGRILDHTQKIYEIRGRAPLSPPKAPARPPSPIKEIPPSPQSLQIKPSRRKKILESTQTSSHPPSSLSGSQPFEIDPPVPTRSDYVASFAPEETTPKDDLDMMIDEAKKIGSLPLEDEEEESKSAEEIETTDGEHASPEQVKRQKKTKGRRGKSNKPGDYLGAFQCMQKNDGNQMEGNPNQRTIEILSEMQRYYEMLNDTWRSLGYRKAIATLKKQDHKIKFANEARELPGIGNRIALKIEEIVRTDRLRRLEYTKMDPEDEALRLFLGIYGVGGVKAQKWVDAGHNTLDDIKAHVRLTPSQQIGIEHYEDFQQRIPRDEVKQHGDIVMRVAHEIDAELKLEILGSYRRGAKDCGDIDIMITKEGAEAHSTTSMISFSDIWLATSRGTESAAKWHGASKVLTGPWRRIDFLVVPWAERGAALLYFTGSDIFNRSLRLLASKKGFRLNQSGLYKDVMRGRDRTKFTDGILVEGESEEKIFEILGVPYRPPEHRVC